MVEKREARSGTSYGRHKNSWHLLHYSTSPTIQFGKAPHQRLIMASKLPQSFISKKACILQALSVPEAEYDDLSPKGSIDVGILDLISEINALEGCVTTSSCAGRISVFLEGHKRKDGEGVDGERENEQAEGTRAGVGGKGGGGRWLFVSHDPVEGLMEERWMEGLGMSEGYEEKLEVGTGARLVHFKFEPMVSILFLLTASRLILLRFFMSSQLL